MFYVIIHQHQAAWFFIDMDSPTPMLELLPGMISDEI